MKSTQNSREFQTTYGSSYPNYFQKSSVSNQENSSIQREHNNPFTKTLNNRSLTNTTTSLPPNQNRQNNLETASSLSAVSTSPLNTSATFSGQTAPKMSTPNFHHMFSQIAKINDFLYLSSLNPVRLDNLRSLGISLVVSATIDPPPVRVSDIETVHVSVEDTEYSNLRSYFDRVSDRINAEERRGGKVLVHCMAGVSRSATLVLVYLMKYRNMTLRDAFNYVRSVRPYISPNIGFWKQMLDYEERIHKTRSVKLVSSGRGFIPDVLMDNSSSSASTSNPGSRQQPYKNFKSGFSRF